ncbi:MAG: phosphatidylinositol-specific phospholipase C/glycerophosphodiester phosphodiesterase family protein [Fimbriimonadaceae bacterium]|nr:phosphatidylinositol-specific phospholipase C/glycerophosphodiester phosphodiesterase family protein [Fimbriimonadaceae bacterium]
MVAFFLAAVLVAGPGSPMGAHAHNDYRHPRPLLDALDHGFLSVEADVYLMEDRLLVGHDAAELTPGRTLDALYLAPLFSRARKQGGRVFPGLPRGKSFQLLIDVKDEAEPAWRAIERALAPYHPFITEYRDGRVVDRGVRVVVSGNRAIDAMRRARRRWTFVDGRAGDLEADPPASLVPLVSENWRGLFSWPGLGPIGDADRERLRAFVDRAHRQGRTVRFWGAPDLPASWDLQREAGVDWINTDRLAEFRAHWAGGAGE